MRKILSILLMAVLLVSIVPVAYAAERGDTVDVSFAVSGNPGFTDYTATINYDHAALELINLTNGSLTSGMYFTPNIEYDLALDMEANNITANGVLFVATFKIKDSAAFKTHAVTAFIEAYNEDGDEVSLSVSGGSVTVECKHSNMTDWEEKTPATCDAAQVLESHCEDCGANEQTKTGTGKLGHNYGAWEKKDDNEHKKTCANGCDEDLTAAHNWVEGVDNASCNQGGTRTDTCSDCQCTRVVETAATGKHNYVVSKSDDTNHWNECGCGAKDQTSVKSHEWVAGNDDSATCGGAGTRTDTCSGCDRTKTVKTQPTGKHEFKTYTTDGKDTHTATCTGCTATDTKAHAWNAGDVTKEPTCKDEGEKTFTCSTCSGTKTAPVAATGKHVYTNKYEDNGDGKTHTGICVCGTKNTQAENHKLVLKDTVNPDCKNDGEKTYECSLCKAIVMETLPSTGNHNYETWTSDGDKTHTSTCTGCNSEKKIEDHIWNNGDVTLEPTCKDTGVKTFTCTANGCGQTKTETLDKTTNHTYGDWTSVDENNHKHVCTVCAIAEETKAHEWKLQEKQAATCVAAGYEKYVCVCGAEKTKELPVDPDAHSLDYTKNEDSKNHTVSCANEGCAMESFFEDHDYSIHGATSGRNQEMLCACGDKIIVVKKASSADLDDVPKTGDITNQVVAVVVCTMVSMIAAVAYTFKRKAVK